MVKEYNVLLFAGAALFSDANGGELAIVAVCTAIVTTIVLGVVLLSVCYCAFRVHKRRYTVKKNEKGRYTGENDYELKL